VFFALSNNSANSARVTFGNESARLFLPAIGLTLLFQFSFGIFEEPQLTSEFPNLVLNMLKQGFHLAALAGSPCIYPLPNPFYITL
jgi:hypothetical protein